MIDLLGLHKEFLSRHIREGDAVADMTMGNGHDTLWLSDAVGENGKVFAFDIQTAAVESTRALLEREAKYRNYELILDSHSNVKNYVDLPIRAAVFNLGYLPGGDKSITTLLDTTLAAVAAAVDLLGADGIVLIAVYPGHAEGSREGAALEEMLAGYDRRKYCVSCVKIVNSPTSPYFIMIESK